MNGGEFNLQPTPKNATSSRDGKRSPRIVHIDDEISMTEVVVLLIRRQFSEATILSFQNRDTAWQELQRVAPDLLITDMNNHNVPGRTEYMGMSGWEMLPMLAKQEIEYPVMVVSGCFSLPGMEARARELAGSKMRATFLTKPFPIEFFQQELGRLLSSGYKAG